MTKVKNYPVAGESRPMTMQSGEKEIKPQSPILVQFLEDLTDEVTKARSLSTRIDFFMNSFIDTGCSDDAYPPDQKGETQNNKPCFTDLINEEIDSLKAVNIKFEKIAHVLEILIGDPNED